MHATATPTPNTTGNNANNTNNGTNVNTNTNSSTSNTTSTSTQGLQATITASENAGTVGKKVTFTVNVTGGSGSYLYSYYTIAQNRNVINHLQDAYKSNNSISWTPTLADTYDVWVSIKDQQTGNVKEVQISFDVTGTSQKAKIQKITVKKSGKKYKFSVSATNARGSVKYKYIIRGAGKKYVANYSSSNTRVIKLSKKGTYKVTAYVKSTSGVVSKTKSFIVK